MQWQWNWKVVNLIESKKSCSYILITFPDGSIDLNISSILPHYLLRRLIKRAGIIKSLLSAGWVIASNKSIKLSTFFIKPSVQWKSPLLQNTPENSVAFLCIIRRYSGGPRLYLEDDAACICEGTVRSDRWVNVYARLVQPILASRPGVPSYVPVLYLRTCHVRAAAYPARTVPRQTSPFSTPWTADEKMPICMDKIYLLQCILYYLKLSLTWSLAQDSVDD